jgi:hypothetical protein
MDEQTFQAKFNELLDRIRDLPDPQRNGLEQIAEETKQRRDRITKSVTELQDSLDYLRLSVKYLVFDLEATRRENAYLRKLIEQSNRDSNPNRRPPQKHRDQVDDNFLEEDHDGDATGAD